MIYGLNFGAQPIPLAYRRRFALNLPIYRCATCLHLSIHPNQPCPICAHDWQGMELTQPPLPNFTRWKPKGEHGLARLAGVCTDVAELQAMRAGNGTRRVFWTKRKTAGADCYGIYCY